MPKRFRLLPVLVVLLIPLCTACGDDSGPSTKVTYLVSSTSMVTNVTWRDASGDLVMVNPAAAVWSNVFFTTKRPLTLECTGTVYGSSGMWMPGGDPMLPDIWFPMLDTMTVTISVDGSNVASATANGTASVIICSTNYQLP